MSTINRADVYKIFCERRTMCAKKRANYTARDGRGLNINYADYSCEIGVLGYHCDGMKDEEGSLSATRHLHARERNTTRAFTRARARATKEGQQRQTTAILYFAMPGKNSWSCAVAAVPAITGRLAFRSVKKKYLRCKCNTGGGGCGAQHGRKRADK